VGAIAEAMVTRLQVQLQTWRAPTLTTLTGLSLVVSMKLLLDCLELVVVAEEEVERTLVEDLEECRKEEH